MCSGEQSRRDDRRLCRKQRLAAVVSGQLDENHTKHEEVARWMRENRLTGIKGEESSRACYYRGLQTDEVRSDAMERRCIERMVLHDGSGVCRTDRSE
jgi:hypothetical protein